MTTVLEACTGSGSSGVFVCYAPEDAHHVTLLANILKAVQLNWPDELLTLQKADSMAVSFGQLQRAVDLKVALLFGVAPASLGVGARLQLYQPVHLNECTYLAVDALEKIEGDKNLKKQLWTALQIIFSN